MYDMTVMGNSPVDVLTHVEESYLEKYNLNKADFQMVDAATFAKIAEECTFVGMEAGGSCANSAWALGKMGKHIHFIGHVGNDPAGKYFYGEMNKVGIKMPAPKNGSHTMEIFVLITPDGERTFVSRGVTAPITPNMIDEAVLQKTNWLLLEGYTTVDQFDAVLHAIKLAKKHNVKIAFSISADFVLHMKHKEIFEKIIPQIDLFFANEDEYTLLYDYLDKSESEIRTAVQKKFNNIDFVVTYSEKGACLVRQGEEIFAETHEKEVLDATGAGDAFTAGFFFKYIEGDVKAGLNLGHQIAGEVIGQLGARLKNWDDINQKRSA